MDRMPQYRIKEFSTEITSPVSMKSPFWWLMIGVIEVFDVRPLKQTTQRVKSVPVVFGSQIIHWNVSPPRRPFVRWCRSGRHLQRSSQNWRWLGGGGSEDRCSAWQVTSAPHYQRWVSFTPGCPCTRSKWLHSCSFFPISYTRFKASIWLNIDKLREERNCATLLPKADDGPSISPAPSSCLGNETLNGAGNFHI